jgi:hypothetical protein
VVLPEQHVVPTPEDRRRRLRHDLNERLCIMMLLASTAARDPGLSAVNRSRLQSVKEEGRRLLNTLAALLEDDTAPVAGPPSPAHVGAPPARRPVRTGLKPSEDTLERLRGFLEHWTGERPPTLETGHPDDAR